MKKTVLSFLAIVACALCVFSSCGKNDTQKVIVDYTVVPIGSTSSSEWGTYQNSMKAAVKAAVEIFNQEYGHSYESEANDKAAIKACDGVYAKRGPVDFPFTLALRKDYASSSKENTRSVILKEYKFE